jgi:hypothetical protein
MPPVTKSDLACWLLLSEIGGRERLRVFVSHSPENYAKADVPFELETALRGHGCNFSFVEPWQPYSITDGRLVTGQNPASALGVGVRVVTILESNA